MTDMPPPRPQPLPLCPIIHQPGRQLAVHTHAARRRAHHHLAGHDRHHTDRCRGYPAIEGDSPDGLPSRAL